MAAARPARLGRGDEHRRINESWRRRYGYESYFGVVWPTLCGVAWTPQRTTCLSAAYPPWRGGWTQPSQRT